MWEVSCSEKLLWFCKISNPVANCSLEHCRLKLHPKKPILGQQLHLFLGEFFTLKLYQQEAWDQKKLNYFYQFRNRILSWEIAQGVQNIPESSLQYANDNALMLAKVLWNNFLFTTINLLLLTIDFWCLKCLNIWLQSLRGTLLAIVYSSTLLSALTSVGLVLLGIQIKSEKNWALGVLPSLGFACKWWSSRTM